MDDKTDDKTYAERVVRYEALYRLLCDQNIQIQFDESFFRDYAIFQDGLAQVRQAKEEAVRAWFGTAAD